MSDAVQCFPTMSLLSSTLYTFPLQGPVSWSIVGGDGSPSPHAIPGFIGNVAPDEIYIEGGNLLRFNTATSHSANTEAYLLHATASGLYTASVSVTNGPCVFTETYNIKMVSASSNAGPDQVVCVSHGSDVSILTAGNGTTGLWQYLGGPPAVNPTIGNPTNPVTKITQPDCVTYEYSWTISSQSLHILNEDTFSVICEDTDTVSITTTKEITSGSNFGILGTNAGATASIFDTNSINRAPIEVNVIGCPPYQFSFTADVDSNVNQVSWSVYMSESIELGGASVINPPAVNYPDKANNGVMGKFEGNNPSFFMIGGNIINSESNAANKGRAVQQGTIPPVFPSPGLVSSLFNFSSSFTASYGSKHLFSLTQEDTECGCHEITQYGVLRFHPQVESFDIVLPSPGAAGGPGGSSTAGHATDNEITFTLATNFMVFEPSLSMSIPKYHNVTIMSFHSGSNNRTPTTNSAVCSKGVYPNGFGNPMAPYLTMSYCTGIDFPIEPLVKMRHLANNSLFNTTAQDNRIQIHPPLRSTIDVSAPVAPFWSGSATSSFPHRDHGLTSGSAPQRLSFEWRARELHTYRGNGAAFTAPGVINGMFVDTLNSISFEESPTFFPAIRNAVNPVIGLPGGTHATDDAVHAGYRQLGGDFGSVASQSLELQCTMSRVSEAGTILEQRFASKSVMFTV